jgi:hypothetical protein
MWRHRPLPLQHEECNIRTRIEARLHSFLKRNYIIYSAVSILQHTDRGGELILLEEHQQGWGIEDQMQGWGIISTRGPWAVMGINSPHPCPWPRGGELLILEDLGQEWGVTSAGRPGGGLITVTTGGRFSQENLCSYSHQLKISYKQAYDTYTKQHQIVVPLFKHDPCGVGLEYLHRSPASRMRRQKGNPTCSWGI